MRTNVTYDIGTTKQLHNFSTGELLVKELYG